MKRDDFTARVMKWVERMKREGDTDIAALLARVELYERRSASSKRKLKVQLKASRGKSGAFFITPQMLQDIEKNEPKQ
ncbi:MAG: hypothetical protein MOGMAGMI_02533 [Candidatus Omnitrophica bacterium]|nr:hypothetical protein [Candidatus Omnitrophota bacterium]